MNDRAVSCHECASDEASICTLEKAQREGVELSFDRVEASRNRCGFGLKGTCCRLCHMGPCRISPKTLRGVCGADEDAIVARNFLREVAAGTAAHADHARHLVLLLEAVAEGLGGDYRLKDEDALRAAARLYRIEESERPAAEVALALARLFLDEFSKQHTPLKTLGLAPTPRQGVWKKAAVEPLGIDRMAVESLHRTTMGVDHDPENLLRQAFRTALADGWGGSRIAAIVSDILFGSSVPVRSTANLGVLSEKTVNILVHGHDPALSEVLAIVASEAPIKEAARAAGAEGVTLAGICCTANEILMRHGIPIAGNFLQQELAIVTGAVEMMILDVQCCMPGLPEVAAAYHTIIVSTSDMARTVGAVHERFDRDRAMDIGRDLLRRAIDNYARRDKEKVAIPPVSRPLVAGFSVNSIKYMLGGRFRGSFRPLNDAVMQGRIRGIAAIVGCNNPRTKMDAFINTLTAELVRHDVLVLKTGCAAIASAKSGMLTPEAALEVAGYGLREVCEAVGMPPVLHMGSCVDNSRLLDALTEIVAEGGLGTDLSDVPVVGIAPEWMSEKAVAIGCYFVVSGIDVILGSPFSIEGSAAVHDHLCGGVAEAFGASFHECLDPSSAFERALEIIEARRARLGINKKAERKLFQMKDRRELHV